MAFHAHQRSTVTEQEFLALPETTDRVELLDGEVFVSPSPSRRHQRVLLDLVAALHTWSRAHPPTAIGLAPQDVRFGPSRILQPDAFVVLAGLADDVSGPIDVVPDVVIEVLSGRRSVDRITKRVVYAEASVPEYWVVDPEEARVEIHHGLVLARVEEEAVTSTRLPGFSLPLAGWLRPA